MTTRKIFLCLVPVAAICGCVLGLILPAAAPAQPAPKVDEIPAQYVGWWKGVYGRMDGKITITSTARSQLTTIDHNKKRDPRDAWDVFLFAGDTKVQGDGNDRYMEVRHQVAKGKNEWKAKRSHCMDLAKEIDFLKTKY